MKHLILFLFILQTILFGSNQINLTVQEQTYIKNKKEIIVSSETDYEPFDFVKNGKPSGYSIELLELLLKDTGLKIKYVTKPWKDLVSDFEENKIDLLHSLFKNTIREEKYDFSYPYLKTSNSFITHINTPLPTKIEDLYGKKIAVGKGWSQDQLLEKYPKIQRVYFKNTDEMLDAVNSSKVYATTLGTAVAKYKILKEGFVNLDLNPNLKELDGNETQSYHFCTLKNQNKELLSILNKSLQNIDVSKLNELQKKWFGSTLNGNIEETILLTKEEQEYLSNNKFNIHLNEWAPFRIYDKTKDEYSGMAIDYFKEIVKSINLKYDFIHYDTYTQRVQKEKIDKDAISIFTAKIDSKKDYSNFTVPFTSYPIGVVTSTNEDFILDFANLNGKKIAVGKNFSAYKFLKQFYPDINYVFTKNTLEAVDMVHRGEVYGAIDLLPILNHTINIYNYSNIKISGISEQKIEVVISVNKSHEKLIGILNKAINALPKDLKQEIENRWLYSKTVNVVSYEWLLYVVGVLIFIIILTQYRFVQNTLKSKKEIEKLLEKEYELTTGLIEAQRISKIGSWKYLIKTDTHIWSDGIYEIYDRDKKLGPANIEEVSKYFEKDSWDNLISKVNEAIENKSDYEVKATVITIYGEKKFIMARGEPIFDKNHELIGLQGIVQDITSKVLTEQKEKRYIERLEKTQKLGKLGAWTFNLKTFTFTLDNEIKKRYQFDLNQETFTVEEVLSKNDEEGAIKAQEAIANTIATNKGGSFVHKIVTDKIYFVESTWEVECDDKGIAIKAYGYDRDITEQYLAQQKEKNLTEMIVKSQTDTKSASIWHDEDFNNFKVSPNVFTLFEVEPIENPSHDFFMQFIDIESIKDIESNVKRKHDKLYTVNATTAKGKKIVLLTNQTHTIDSNGKITYHITTQDITERVLAQKEKDEQNALLIKQSRLAQMGEMISMIAHQWRQPLNALSIWQHNFISIVDEHNLDEPHLPMIKDKLQTLVKKLDDTINDFTNFFKSDKEITEFSIRESVLLTMDLISEKVNSSRIDFIVNIDNDILHKGYINELSQVFMVIIDNAIDEFNKSSLKNKKLIIDAKENEDNTMSITFIDNAGGIPEDIIDKIFEPYFSTKSLNGTGIGLYMTKIIIENSMKGKINASNTEDGACFTIILPKEIEKKVGGGI